MAKGLPEVHVSFACELPGITRGQRSEIRSQRSEIRGQNSEIRSQKLVKQQDLMLIKPYEG